MQLKKDSHVQRFLDNPENTMNTELCANVGLVLHQLANHFAPTHPNTTSQSDILKQIINDSITTLAKKVAMQSKAVQKAWEYLQNKLNEPQDNILDTITIWIDGVENKYLIDLKTTVALVYLALTDKNTFWQDALKKQLSPTASKKEKITFREQFEKSYLQEENDRLSTLWHCFIDLQNKNRCHLGIRNELTMSLNGVYPGVWFIEDFELFLRSFLSEHLHQLIEAFKPSPTRYKTTLLAKMSGEHSDDLQKALEQSKPDLLERIQNTCLAHGINPKHAKIMPFIDALPDLDLSWEGDGIMSSLAALYDPQKMPDTLLLNVKQWILTTFELANEVHKQAVITFAKAYKVNTLYKSHNNLLRSWDQNIITSNQLDTLNINLNQYLTQCLEGSSLQPASDELHRALNQFLIAHNQFEYDAQSLWIENFFAHWGMAKNEGAQGRLRQLYDELYSPQMQKKYLVTDTFLEQQFRQIGDEEVDVTPYLINRVFLHAITVHPQLWNGLFFNYLSFVYDFVLNEIAEQDFRGLKLKRDSYPEDLLSQIKYLLDYYQGLKPTSITSFIPMKGFIVCTKDYQFMLNYLATPQALAFLDSLSNEDFHYIINGYKDLSYILSSLKSNKRTSFINSLNVTVLKKCATNATEFTSLINPMSVLSVKQKKDFIDSLDNEFFERIIITPSHFESIITSLPETLKNNLINTLKPKFLQSLIYSVSILENMAKLLAEEQKTNFVNSLDNEFLKNLIISVPALKVMLGILTENKKIDLVNSLDNDCLKKITSYSYQFPILFQMISEKQKESFVDSLSDKHLKKMSTSIYDFIELIKHIPESRKDSFIDFFINSMSEEFLNTLQSNYELVKLISCLSITQLPAFIGHLKMAITNCIQNNTDYNYIINNLPEDKKKVFINSMDAQWLQNITNNTKPIISSFLQELKRPEAINYRQNKIVKSSPSFQYSAVINPEIYTPTFFNNENHRRNTTETQNNTNASQHYQWA